MIHIEDFNCDHTETDLDCPSCFFFWSTDDGTWVKPNELLAQLPDEPEDEQP